MIVHAILQGNVQTVIFAFALSDIADISCTGKVSRFVFVNGECKYFGSECKCVFHTITMMHIKVDVQHFIIDFAQMLYGYECIKRRNIILA